MDYTKENYKVISKSEFKQKIEAGFSKEKQAYAKQFKISIVYFLISTLVLVSITASVSLFLLDKDSVVFVVPIFIFLFFLVSVLPTLSIKSNFLKKFKEEAFPKFFNILLEGELFSYNHEGHISSDIFDSSNIFSKNYNRFSGEDFFLIEIPYGDGNSKAVFFGLGPQGSTSHN